MSDGGENWACGLCKGPVAHAYDERVLDKYTVRYGVCGTCGSLQTEKPYWLDEAYPTDVNVDDTGYLLRNLLVQRNMMFLLRLMNTPRSARILDYGGGLGIVPRLLRENGYDAYCYDTYTVSPFPDVAWPGGDKADAMLAVELFEHLGDQAGEIERMFAFAPDWFYVRTWRYFGQDRSWDYIAAYHGQHTFFYTNKAMAMIAERHGYTAYLPNDVDTFFSRKPLSSLQQAMLAWGLKRESTRRLFNGLFRLSGR